MAGEWQGIDELIVVKNSCDYMYLRRDAILRVDNEIKPSIARHYQPVFEEFDTPEGQEPRVSRGQRCPHPSVRSHAVVPDVQSARSLAGAPSSL